ncbi:MAG: universal stress protein, partial [Nocardioidaceae bacterium]
VHGWRNPVRGPAGDGLVDEIRSAERLLAEALAGFADRYPDVQVAVEALPLPPQRVLTEASRSAALVVVGSHGRGPLSGLLLGSVSAAVLHHAACAVAVVR